jgi:hypothetical protein
MLFLALILINHASSVSCRWGEVRDSIEGEIGQMRRWLGGKDSSFSR